MPRENLLGNNTQLEDPLIGRIISYNGISYKILPGTKEDRYLLEGKKTD